MSKYINLFYGLSLEVRNTNLASDDISTALNKYFLRLFSTDEKVNVTKKNMKENNLIGVSDALDNCYYASIQLLEKSKPSRETLTSALKAMRVLFEACGIQSSYNEKVYAEDYKLVMDCLSISATGGRSAVVGVNKVTSLATFKKAFLNTLYSEIHKSYHIRFNSRIRNGIEKHANK